MDTSFVLERISKLYHRSDANDLANNVRGLRGLPVAHIDALYLYTIIKSRHATLKADVHIQLVLVLWRT